MRNWRLVISIPCLVFFVAACASKSTDEEGGEASSESAANKIGAINENDLSSGGGDSSAVASAPEQDSTQVEDELKLDEDKSGTPPEDLQAFDEVPQAQPAEPQVAQNPPPPAVEPPPPVAPNPEPAPPTQAFAPRAEAAQITDMQFLAQENGGTVLITSSAPVRFQSRRNEAERQFIVEIEGASLPERLKRPYITKEFNSPIAAINAYQSAGSNSARVVVQLRENTPFQVRQEGLKLVVAPSGGPSETTQVAKDQPPSSTAANPPQTVENSSASSFEEFLTGDTKFYGRKINIEVNDEDIRNVLNLIAEESGANIVLDDKVTGNISVRLRQVPWDQALVVVMKTKGLGYVRQGNVLRIAPLDTLKKESDTAREIVESHQKVDQLKVKIVPVNYGNVDDLVKQSEKFLSARGKIAADNRTSSLVITDVADSIERIVKLIKSLDVPPDQVLIEGKIVEANSDFSRNIGVKWNASGQPVPLGNTPSGLPVNLNPSLGFNQGGNLVSSGLGASFRLGTLDVLGDLNASLALFESEQQIKVVSSPRVVTMNREKSQISQSDEIPVLQVSQSGNGPSLTTVRYEAAELKLEVTPQITPNGGVIMDIGVKREFFGQASSAASSPPKFSREAKTKIMVKTGQTAVIGGIYDNTQTEREEGVPGLRKIPVIGWLFKNRSRLNKKNELIIFLTPRVLSKNDQLQDGSP